MVQSVQFSGEASIPSRSLGKSKVARKKIKFFEISTFLRILKKKTDHIIKVPLLSSRKVRLACLDPSLLPSSDMRAYNMIPYLIAIPIESKKFTRKFFKICDIGAWI